MSIRTRLADVKLPNVNGAAGRIHRKFQEHWEIITRRRRGTAGLVVLVGMVILAVVGPYIAPYGTETVMQNGQVISNQAPSLQHPFGTNWVGQDIFSLMLHAIRTDLIVGLLSGAMVMTIGANIGLISGYYGGRIDSVLMRITDLVYGLPLEPFAIVLISLTGPSLVNIVVAISLILWRTVARVIRSEVLSLKTSTYVEVARDRGVSDYRIIYRHIAPNIFHLLFLYATFSISWGIIFNAGLSFLGFGDPNRLSLGGLMYDAWSAAVWPFAWWTFVFPGMFIVLLVLSVFFIGQAYEEEANPQLKSY
jgi:peptide/nickel transport system permease protein